MAAEGADFISFTADGARHRYRFDHGLQGPGDLDADVRIRLKPYLVGHSILRHKVPAAQAGQDVEPQTWPSRVEETKAQG